MADFYYAEGLIHNVLDREALVYQGVRKIVLDQGWICRPRPGTEVPTFWYGPNKFHQMNRNYLNIPDIERCREILAKRKKQTFTSVAVSMRNGAKESRSQGWCMNSLVIMRTRDKTIAEVQYRSTELVLKFTGDMVWLPGIFTALGIMPDVIRFHFASCYLSGVYFPYVCSQWEPIEFLRLVYKLDQKLFAQGTRFFLRSAYKEDQVFPYSPENVAHRFGWKYLKKQMPRIRDFLEEKHKAFGKPLPHLHYKAGEYIPRGQRVAEND